MALQHDDDNDTTPLTLEEAYHAFDRLNPFHASGPPTVAMIRRLQGQPHAKKLFYGRQTLLHKCCCDGYADRLDLIQALVEIHPDAMEMYDQDGYWPLHYVVAAVRGRKGGRTVNRAVVELLIQQGPLALLQTARNERRAIPLHLAVENAAITVEVVDLLLQVFPETIHYQDANGRLPIECAVRTTGVAVEVIERLISAAPVLLSFVRDGSLLLHRFLNRMEAVEDDIDEEIIFQSTPTILRDAILLEKLIKACPRALSVQTAKGHETPLAMACEGQVAVPCLYELIRAWPEQVTTQRHLIFDDREWNGVWLPTHLLQANLSWRHVIRWLDQDPRAATTRDAAGRVALHYAVVTQASCAVPLVRELLRMNPAAVQIADHEGRLPLHYLAISTHEHREELLEMLLTADDGSLAVHDNERCLPWMYAELVHFTAVYEASLERGVSVDHMEDLPSEVRWDFIQILDNTD